MPAVGKILKAARVGMGWTQAQAGARAGFSASAISRIERGQPVDLDTLRRLADCYRLPPEQLGLATVAPQGWASESGDDVDRRQILTAVGLTIPARMLNRLEDALVALPDPTGPPSPRALSAALAQARHRFDNGDHAALVTALPHLLSAAHHLGEGADPRRHAMIASCYEVATHALVKIGRHQSSRLTADRAVTYARLSGDPQALALASRALSIVLRHEGRPELAQRVNLTALTDLEATGLAEPSERTVYAQMLCSTAYAAAQAGDRAGALELATEADRALEGLSQAPNRAATPMDPTLLTPAQAQLYKVGMYWALGDSAAALHSARGLRPAQFPTPERRARLHTDLARAWWQHGRPEQTATSLLAAYEQAPAEVLDRPGIGRIAQALIRRHPHVAQVRRLHVILRTPGAT
ncbi:MULTISPECIES: helix-turn-helix domain-containing protein [Actinosynnema]|uniref:helix-turn-helix domain-containing protein n=1 Tax=Actinosynnema TaxID=40566 RepID=UPI0020A56944|nr:helix-turn-helix transcriptional regulator [Actinosynnema pretiosum]MCP2100001.1 Helix-turn-helix domain-containing protein [Actinosynnema pretiosum]